MLSRFPHFMPIVAGALTGLLWGFVIGWFYCKYIYRDALTQAGAVEVKHE